MNHEWWDFNEDKNYVNIKILDRNYKVIKNDNSKQSALLLYFLELFMNIKLLRLKNKIRYINTTPKIKNGLMLLLTTQCYLQEMQLNTNFEGLNKPKKIYMSDRIEIGKDGKLRAKYRIIFLNLKNKSIKNLKKLLIHEMAHTAANHVKWRDDDHGKDFKTYENIIKEL